VQRVDDQIRVEAHLFDVRTSRRLWAQRYERPLAEVLAIRSAMMHAIVAALDLPLSEAERALLFRVPTTNARAYDLYLRGRELELRAPERDMPAEDIREAQSLYTRARDLDPNFAMARSRLALTHIYSGMKYDPTPARFEQARLEAETALRLQPGLAEAHEALAAYWDVGRKDDAKSIEQIKLTLAGWPNSVEHHMSLAASYRKQGRWDEAVAALERARQLEPRSLAVAGTATQTYTLLRRYEESVKAWDLMIALNPDNQMFKLQRAFVFLIWQGTADTIAATLRRIPPNFDQNGVRTLAAYLVARVGHRNNEAIAVLNASRHEVISSPRVYNPLSLMRGQTYEALGDHVRARSNYEAARTMLIDSIAAQKEEHLDYAASPPVARMRIALGLAYAGLGRTQEAVREARLALDLVPLSSNTLAATAAMAGAAQVFVLAGETNAALELLELLLGMPAGHEVSVAILRGNPAYDRLHGDPRFEKLLERFSLN
jgi:serine/threonine-protein kinase